MEKKIPTLSPPSILWLQVSGLAAMQGAISLTWIIYRVYLPELLKQFGFPGLDKTIQIVEDGFAVVVEPLMGGLSDQTRRWIGTRFPFIAVGVILSSGLFIAIPAVVIFGNPSGVLRWVLPVVLVAWALAMAVFRSPAVALLGQYAAVPELPQAFSLLILVGGLVGAIRPLASGLILSLGPGFTFTIGAIALLAAAAVLRAVNPQATINPLPAESTITEQKLSIPSLALILGLGASIGWGFRLLILDVFPKVVAAELGLDMAAINGLISIGLAIFSLFAGAIAVRVGNQLVMLTGIATTIVLSILLGLIHGAIAVTLVAIALLACFSLVWNGTVPLALSLLPPAKGGLAVGIYFGGFSAAMSLFSLVMSPQTTIAPIGGVLIAAIAFLIAGLCILSSSNNKIRPTFQ